MQFGLLFIGIVARILVINADRKAMAIASLSIISAALVTGFLWGGKTWCNYFCPANIVQKIYTEPGGILE
ncbi:4Fe-4S binding protein, partial [Rhizobium ruizarguesonis]